MSESEKKKRARYRQRRRIALTLLAVLLVAATLVTAAFGVALYRINRTIYIDYTESGKVDYTVALKPNDFYDATTLPAGQSYVASLIDGVAASFDYVLSAPTKQMFDLVGRHSTFLYRVLFANLWCFGPVLSLYSKLSGGEMNAIVRTTTAFTQMEGSKGVNVIPPVAKMASNHRIIPGETVESTVAHIKKAVKDKNVEVSVINGNDPSVISRTDCEAYDRVRSSVAETWQDAIVTPYLMVAGSDSRHWGEISDKVYRFSAMALTKEERGYIHGNNERIPFATISRTVEFFERLMRKS